MNKLEINGNLVVVGDLEATGDLIVTGSLSVTGSLYVHDDCTVFGNISVIEKIDVGNKVSANSIVCEKGEFHAGADVTCTGHIKTKSGTFIDGNLFLLNSDALHDCSGGFVAENIQR